VFGGNFTGAVAHLGGTGDDTLTGTAAAEAFVGGTGNDTMIGFGGGCFPGRGRQRYNTGLDARFLPGRWRHWHRYACAQWFGLHLDLATLADSRTRSLERIDITGTGDNTLTLSVRDVLNLSGESNELLVKGDAGDMVNQGRDGLP
jgi:Ca2+-binding RTX toxin-like protein